MGDSLTWLAVGMLLKVLVIMMSRESGWTTVGYAAARQDADHSAKPGCYH